MAANQLEGSILCRIQVCVKSFESHQLTHSDKLHMRSQNDINLCYFIKPFICVYIYRYIDIDVDLV